MKFKNGSKRFLTLNPNNSEGFTLVELIVVIAILAILAGVAVPAYNGYIEKANKQADISLISEIEHALTLAYYNGDFEEGESGYIMLEPNAPASIGSATIVGPMEKVFGSSWFDTLQLKHDGWGVKNQILNYEDAQNVINSTYVQKYSSSELMAQVQALTDAVNGLSFNIGDTQIELYHMFGYTDAEGNKNAIDDVIEEYDIGKTWNEMSNTEKSNVLVLATASSISDNKGAIAAGIISEFALYTAYAAENAEFNTAYKTFQTAISNVDPGSADSQYSQIKAAFNTLKAAATSTGFDTWNSGYVVNGTNTNQAAFEAIMAGVGNAMKDNGDAVVADLGNANMFTSGVGNELYNDYLNSAYSMVADTDGFITAMQEMLSDEEFAGWVMVWYSVVNGTLYIDNSLPVA